MKNRSVMIAVIIFSMLSVFTVGYAASVNKLGFNGYAALNPILNIDIVAPLIENMRSGESASTTVVIDDNDTLNFSIVLIEPGDTRRIGFQILNKGNQAAKLGEFVNLVPLENPAIDVIWPNLEEKVIMPRRVFRDILYNCNLGSCLL